MRHGMLLALLVAVAGCAPGLPASTSPPSREAPGRPAVPTTRLVPAGGVRRDLDCADFASGAAAQGVLHGDGRDPHRLDADRDGVACEKLPR